ncbi:MAG: GNAT family N-acetyltransferase [Actinobacteria bacterium]|nr:GNAT family N-acetyltransferase [Actinomycetota bacterium]
MSAASRAERVPAAALQEDEVLLDAWRRLAEARANPFLTPEWTQAWLGAYPAEEPFVIAWKVGDEVRGVLPLVAVREGATKLLRFAGARRGDWFTPACAEVDEVEMGRACAALLGAERGAWNQLRLDRIDRESAWPQVLWADGAGGRLAAAAPRRTDVLPFIDLAEGGWEAYLARRSRNFRSQLGRRRRKLEREHELSFRMTTDPAALAADFETFYRLHEERWEDRGGSSSGEEAVERFHGAFSALALERGWLRLWIAEADGKPAAAWYGWRLGHRYCYALSGLAKEYEPLALGTVLLAHTIEQAAEEGCSIYDLMWGDEGYKSRFETGRREAATWVLGRRGHPLTVGAAARTRLEKLARRVRERRG